MGNLSFDVTREELIEAFAEAGRVVDAKVPTDRETGRPRGFAFVEFEDDEGAQKCIALMNGRDLKGRPLRVNEAESRPPRAGGPGGFSRGPGGGGGYSRGPGGAGSRPSGGSRSFPPAPDFPPPDGWSEFGESKGRRFKQKPVRKSSPKRRRDQVADDDDY